MEADGLGRRVVVAGCGGGGFLRAVWLLWSFLSRFTRQIIRTNEVVVNMWGRFVSHRNNGYVTTPVTCDMRKIYSRNIISTQSEDLSRSYRC